MTQTSGFLIQAVEAGGLRVEVNVDVIMDPVQEQAND